MRWHDILTEDILNRVGIALNFAAGFLLAPGLIGLARIRRAEDRLHSFTERHLGDLRAALDAGENAYLDCPSHHLVASGIVKRGMIVDAVARYPLWLMTVYILKHGFGFADWVAVPMMLIVPILIPYVASFFLYLFAILALGLVKTGVVDANVRQTLLQRIRNMLVPWVFGGTFAFSGIRGLLRSGSEPFTVSESLFAVASIIVPFGISYFIVLLLLSFLKLLLSGEGRLFSMLTATGIFAFCLGNFLQFVATFHPK
jgi:hypothetical protein